MGMAMVRLDCNGLVEFFPDVRLVDVASNHDELAHLLLVRLPRSDHLFVRAVHDGVEGNLVLYALDGEDALDPHEEPLSLWNLRQSSHQARQGLPGHLPILLAADGVHARIVDGLALPVAVAVIVVQVSVATIVVVMSIIAVAVAVILT